MSIFSNPQDGASAASRAYVNALLETLGDNDPIAILAATPEKLAAATAGLPDDALRKPERQGKWSVIEVVGHLADTELVYSFRFRVPLAQERPRITGFDQDAWARRFRYRDADLATLLELHRTVRNANVKLLRSCSAEELQRAGVHEERGPESVELMMKLGAAHDLVHLKQIERIKKTLDLRP
ncbi:MAG TPA: DinB family protein [Thermoanaerobaculia bacterium]|nr:DinB family protein [Thermoanaerobaculia bacterium]